MTWKQRLWHELHARAAAPGPFEARAEARWIADFTGRIPCKGCRAHWRQLLAEHPPDLSGGFAFFQWTVRAHNWVNVLLGKPPFPFAAACRLYRRPDYERRAGHPS